MNQTEEQETDRECNVCGEQRVTCSWGSYTCQNRSCPASRTGELGPNSSDEKIQEYYRKQNEEREGGTKQRLNTDTNRKI